MGACDEIDESDVFIQVDLQNLKKDAAADDIISYARCGDEFCFLITKFGRVFSCGYADSGRLARENTNSKKFEEIAKKPFENNDIRDVSLGAAHSFVLTEKDRLLYGCG